MAYCTYAQIVIRTGTALAQATIEELISQAEGEIDGRLAAEGVTGAASSQLKAASLALTTSYIVLRGRLDGTKPANMRSGDYSESDDLDTVSKELEKKAFEIVDLYIKNINYPSATSSATLDSIVTRVDHQMRALQPDQSLITEYSEDADDYGLEDPDDIV